MGAAALIVLFYTHGSVSTLVVMYSINVFLTFSLSPFGMAKFFFQTRHKDEKWARHIIIHLIGLILCVTILLVTIYEKFGEGGWITLLITAALIGLCYQIRRHYRKVRQGVRELEEILSSLPSGHIYNEEPLNTNERLLFSSVVTMDSVFIPGFLFFANFPSFIVILFLYLWRKLIPALLRVRWKLKH